MAGLQAGMLGGMGLLTVMALFSVLDRHPWWSYPNLLGACFYGVRSIGAGLGWHSVSGLALQLVITGLAGASFGVLFLRGGGRRSILLGLVWGLLVYYLSGQFYRVFKPVVLAYLPSVQALVAHLVYGVSLPWIARLAAPELDPDFGRELAPHPPELPGPGPERNGSSAPHEAGPPTPESPSQGHVPPRPAEEDVSSQE